MMKMKKRMRPLDLQAQEGGGEERGIGIGGGKEVE